MGQEMVSPLEGGRSTVDWNVWRRMVGWMLNGWRNGRCGSIFAVVEGTMGKSVKYVAVMMLAADSR